MASAINGRWFLISSDGLPEYMAAIGTAPESAKKMCQVLEATGAASIQEEIQLDGNTVTVRAFKSDGTLHKENSCKVGEEMDNTGPDGRAIKATITIDGNKIIKHSSGGGYSAVWERTVSGDIMTLVMMTGSTVCTRKFQRV